VPVRADVIEKKGEMRIRIPVSSLLVPVLFDLLSESFAPEWNLLSVSYDSDHVLR
jgi:hypothetical protein